MQWLEREGNACGVFCCCLNLMTGRQLGRGNPCSQKEKQETSSLSDLPCLLILQRAYVTGVFLRARIKFCISFLLLSATLLYIFTYERVGRDCCTLFKEIFVYENIFVMNKSKLYYFVWNCTHFSMSPFHQWILLYSITKKNNILYKTISHLGLELAHSMIEISTRIFKWIVHYFILSS